MNVVDGEAGFVLLDKAEYPKLKALLKTRLPQSAALYNAVQLALTGASDIRIYAYEGQIDDQALFANVFYLKNKEEDDGFKCAYLSTPNPPRITEDLAKAFVAHVQPKSQPPGRPMMFCTTREVTPVVIKVLLDRGATVKGVPNHGFCYPLDKLEDRPQSTRLETPPGVVVKLLEPQHAALVSSVWKYGILIAGGVEATARNYILRNPTAAVFSTDAPDEPLSWAICFEFGKIAMLHTQEGHRGRGYAALVMQRLAEESARRGLVPTCGVTASNGPSLKAMAKAGYVKTHLLDFIFTE